MPELGSTIGFMRALYLLASRKVHRGNKRIFRDANRGRRALDSAARSVPLALQSLKPPVLIDSSVIVYWNPATNGDKAKKSAALFRSVRRFMINNAALFHNGGDLIYRSTKEDPRERIKGIIAEAEESIEKNPERPVVIVSIGGDKTADNVFEAVHVLRSKYNGDLPPKVFAVAGPGGTANDIRAITGVPNSVLGLIRFLGRGNGTLSWLPFIRFDFRRPDGEIETIHSAYGFTGGQSGVVFKNIDELKKARSGTGKKVTVMDAISMLPKGLLDSRTIHVLTKLNEEVLNAGKPFETAEIFGPLATQRMGSVTKLPIPPMGAWVGLPPPLPHGLVPFLEPFVRKIAADVGFRRFVDSVSHLYSLNMDRHICLGEGDVLCLDFFEKDDSPMEVPGTLAGDPVGPYVGLKAQIVGYIPVLCHPNSDLIAQHNMSTGGSLINNALNTVGNFMSGLHYVR